MNLSALVGVGWWQTLLHALGSVLAFIYNVIPNYGLAIILFTLGIRVLLIPLGIKQIRSMQSMQAIQPQMKALQAKYKGNRQRLNEEVMKLYRENGVNPFMGCLPLLAQFPVLIALFAVLQFPVGLTHIPHDNAVRTIATPQDSRLYVDLVCSGRQPSPHCGHVQSSGKTHFLGANLLCNALQAGQPELKVNSRHVVDAPRALDCGSGWPSRIPYYLFAALMITSTFFQQRQMQRVTPASQQQPFLKFMPLLFGFWGFLFPAGLVIYWTTTNLVQIAQQRFMLRGQGPAVETKAREDGGQKRARGLSGIMQSLGLVESEPAPRRRPSEGTRKASTSQNRPRNSASRPGASSGSQTKKTGTSSANKSNQSPAERPRSASASGRDTGGRDGRSRKKRRKR
ncbi:MAG TPA: YidC/Oxa1 family membrane protein insertase [Actinomycetota bacterium]